MEISLQELKELVGSNGVSHVGELLSTETNPFEKMIGKIFFIRTVTYHYTGKVEDVIGQFVRLSKAAWIADSGRFFDALKNENFDEVEPYPGYVFLNTSSIIDFTEIKTVQESQR